MRKVWRSGVDGSLWVHSVRNKSTVSTLLGIVAQTHTPVSVSCVANRNTRMLHFRYAHSNTDCLCSFANAFGHKLSVHLQEGVSEIINYTLPHLFQENTHKGRKPIPHRCNVTCLHSQAIRVMKDQPTTGHVFNMDGAGADGNPTPRFAAYGATKRGLAQLGGSISAELKMLVRSFFVWAVATCFVHFCYVVLD